MHVDIGVLRPLTNKSLKPNLGEVTGNIWQDVLSRIAKLINKLINKFK